MVADGDIGRGQNVWQALGGMEVGSIWGHGSYVAPDWTADWLHREATFVLDEWGNAEFGKPYEQLAAEEQGKLRGRLEAGLPHNSYDAATNTIRIEPVRARAFEACLAHFSDVFMKGEPGLRDPVRQRFSSPERMRQFAGFIFWTAWSAAAERPGDTISLHQQLAVRAAGRQPAHRREPSCGPASASSCCWPASAPWSGGTPRKRPRNPTAPSRATDPLGAWAATPSQRATLKYFWVVSALILVQILMGVVTAHYGVEGDGFYGIKISAHPALQRHPHLARAARHLLDRHRLAGRRPVHRAAGQRQGAEVPGARRPRPVRRPAGDRGRLARPANG